MINAAAIQLIILREEEMLTTSVFVNWYFRCGAIYWNFWYATLKNNLLWKRYT